jgi:hypothetical protein
VQENIGRKRKNRKENETSKYDRVTFDNHSNQILHIFILDYLRIDVLLFMTEKNNIFT